MNKERRDVYPTPSVEVVEVHVEHGFAASDGVDRPGGSGDDFGNWN